MLRRAITAALLTPLAVVLPACSPGLTAGTASMAQAGDYESRLAAWQAARAPYDAAADAYWDAISDKRRIRNAKRRGHEQILLDDYVLEQPPVYNGPPRPVDPNAPPGPRPGEAPPIATIADFIANAKSQFGFVPDYPASDADFKRAYARVALASGLTREQIVGVYAFETGGNGTYDMQAGISAKRSTPISPAVGYNQLLSTNSVSMLAEHDDIVLGDLRRKERELQGEPKRAMARKIEAVRRMIAYAKSVPGKWSEYDKLAKRTAGGIGIHAIVLDRDIGPVVQTQKLLNSVLFARMKGYHTPLRAAELELMNLTGDSTGLDMVTMSEDFRARVPTSNFFQQIGYERNPVARRTAIVGKLIADMDNQMQKGAQNPGARELAAAAN